MLSNMAVQYKNVLNVSYKADSLFADMYLKVAWMLDRSKVSKISKINVYEGCLKIMILGFHKGSLGHGNTGYIKHN